MTQSNNYSPEEIAKIGENFYFQELKDKLEKEHIGEYVVIDVDKEEYVMSEDKLKALQDAREKFGDKLFCIVQVGNIQKQLSNYKNYRYAWKF